MTEQDERFSRLFRADEAGDGESAGGPGERADEKDDKPSAEEVASGLAAAEESTEPVAERVEREAAGGPASEPSAPAAAVPAASAAARARARASSRASAPSTAEADAAAASPETAPADAGATAGTAPRKRWYVVHTYSGHENKVKANLERAIQYNRMQDMFGEILVPTDDFAVMKGGKKRITKRKTFPSYVLLEMVMNDETRALVQNIPGVTSFVGGDRNTAPLTDVELRRIRGQEVKEKGTVTTEVPFKVGESVKIMDGPFADWVGTVDEINPERGKLRVMVSIFGRPTAVELDIAQVTTI